MTDLERAQRWVEKHAPANYRLATKSLAAEFAAVRKEENEAREEVEKRNTQPGTITVCEKHNHIMCDGVPPFGCQWALCPVRSRIKGE